jgi:hypothetical protein
VFASVLLRPRFSRPEHECLAHLRHSVVPGFFVRTIQNGYRLIVVDLPLPSFDVQWCGDSTCNCDLHGCAVFSPLSATRHFSDQIGAFEIHPESSNKYAEANQVDLKSLWLQPTGPCANNFGCSLSQLLRVSIAFRLCWIGSNSNLLVTVGVRGHSSHVELLAGC